MLATNIAIVHIIYNFALFLGLNYSFCQEHNTDAFIIIRYCLPGTIKSKNITTTITTMWAIQMYNTSHQYIDKNLFSFIQMT